MTMRMIGLGLAMLAAASAAPAHVTIAPRQSELGAWERYTVRVPNEKAVPTVRIDARVPRGVRVMSLEDKPGWTIATTRDSAGAITAISWSGLLPPERFTEFGLIAVNPESGETSSWSFVQTYQDGSKVEWSGPPGSKAPASVVTLTPGGMHAAHH